MSEVTFTKHYSSVQRLATLKIKGKAATFSPADKAIYFYLLAYQESTGKVFPSIATLSAELGMSQSTVKRSIKFLREATLIESERRYDDSNLYQVLPISEVIKLATEEKMEKVTIPAFTIKAIDTILRILGMFGINMKQCEKQAEEWGFNTSEASQEALQQDFTPPPVKTHSKETKPLKSAPAKEHEYDFDIPKETFDDRDCHIPKEEYKHDPNGW